MLTIVIVETDTIFAIDASIDNSQEGRMAYIEYENKGAQYIGTLTELDAVGTATDLPINDAHRLEPNSGGEILDSVDEQKLNYSAADGSVSDEPSTSNIGGIEDIVITIDSYEERNPQQHSKEAEIVEVVSKGMRCFLFQVVNLEFKIHPFIDIEATLEIDHATEDTTSVDALDALKSSGDEHIHATQEDAAEVEESVSTEHIEIDQEVVDDATSNAFINSQNDENDATSADDIREVLTGWIVESNGNNCLAFMRMKMN